MSAAELVQFYESISEMGPSEAIKAIERAIAAAVVVEREACALLVESIDLDDMARPGWMNRLADAIRTRGGSKP